MRKLLLTRGLPGSAKSQTLKELGLEDFTLSSDAIRLLLASPCLSGDGRMIIAQDLTRPAWDLLLSALESRMAAGNTTVVDAVHATAQDVQSYLALADRYRYQVACLDFTEVPIEMSEWNNQGRAEYRVVPERSMQRITRSILESPPLPERIARILVKADRSHLKAVHQWLDVPVRNLDHYESVVHVGDLQGCATVLSEALPNGLEPHNFYIFVGDYLDRGIENAEVVRWLLREAIGKSNVTLLHGNHEDHLLKAARGEPSLSDEFNARTWPQLQAAGITGADLTPIIDRLEDVIFYRHKGQQVMVTHGGLPTVPRAPWMVPSRQYHRGSGEYSQNVDLTFNEVAPEGWWQVHGHRNSHHLPVRASARSFNLEESVERGGCLRLVELKEGRFTERRVRNPVFPSYRDRLPRKNRINVPWMGASNTLPLMPHEDLESLRSHPEVQTSTTLSFPHVTSFKFTREAFYSKSWDAVSIRARGLFVNQQTREVVARSYDKFFTVNESESMSLEQLRTRLQFPLTGYRKENGFLGILGYDRQTDSLFIASKSTPEGPFADLFREQINAQFSPVQQEALARWLRDFEACMTFEVIDPIKDPHLVDYERSKMVLLDVLHRSPVFERLPYAELKAVGREFGLEVKQPAIRLETWAAFQGWYRKMSRDMKDQSEGLVLEDARGEMIKTKTPHYSFWKLMRGAKDQLCRFVDGRSKKQPAEEMSAFLETRDLAFLSGEATAFIRWMKEQPPQALTQDILALKKQYEVAQRAPRSTSESPVEDLVQMD